MTFSEDDKSIVQPENSVTRTRRNGINEAMKNLNLPGCTIVRTVEDARRVIKILRQFPERVHAWDTETINIDAKE